MLEFTRDLGPPFLSLWLGLFQSIVAGFNWKRCEQKCRRQQTRLVMRECVWI